MIGYKILLPQGRSIRTASGAVHYDLPKDGKPGAWQTIPGNGAYVAHFAGLFSAGVEVRNAILVEVECREEVKDTGAPEGVRTWRKVRILRVTCAPLEADYKAKCAPLDADYEAKLAPLDAWAARRHTAMMRREFFAARDVAPGEKEEGR